MKNAERHNHLNDTQYEGRQGRMSINPVAIKVLTLEVSHLQRSNMGMTDCNAKACYDQIIPVIAAILETRTGVPANVSTLFARTLQDMRYHTVTAKRISNKTNSHRNKNPSWGSGQGVCDSPVKWGLTSNTIIKCYNKWAIGRKIQDPSRKVQKKRNNAMLVDNASLFHNLMKIFTACAHMIMSIVSCNVTLWGRYLWISGGLLEYNKTQYCIMIWGFTS
eukprot:15361161-Ditylum_brightwellii.AAC.1